MVKKRILMPIICTIAFGLAGCGHKHVWEEATCLAPKTCTECGETEGGTIDHIWAEATCEKAKFCEICGETVGEPLSHEWAEATYEAPKTCSFCGVTEGEPLPEPYCIKNNITFETLQDMDLPFAMDFSEDGKVVDIEGMWIEKGMAHYSFEDITFTPSQKAGYIDITIPYQVTFSATFYSDNTIYNGPFNWNLSYPSFSVGDYYTGTIVPTRSTYTGSNNDGDSLEYSKDYEWNGNTYTIGYSKSVETNSSKSGWITEGNIGSNTYDYTMDCVYSITIPEEFDGTVLCIKRATTEVSFEGKDREEISDKEEHFLDEHDADYFIFFRLSDMQ
ncbi:MAG: hypothetical protein HFI33_01275 [Lachnospiraceae bacterium]|nr:hypothetical protein [Lachnospiraceae bacterium]